MKEYSLRLELKLEANNDDEARKKMELIIKELPRMEGVSFKSHSLRSNSLAKIIESSGK